MESFKQYIPTRVVFGRDSVDALPQVLPAGAARILLAYGGGSVKRSGLYDRVRALLDGRTVFELGSIAANPKLESVYAGLEICRREGVDAIVALGGGSVIDCSKVIAACAVREDDPWALIQSRERVERALPLIAVPTMAATGTELNSSAVVVHEGLGIKASLYGDGVFPYASLLDPGYTCSIPAGQTAAGCADILSHVMESYFVTTSNYLSDQLAEGVMRTIVRCARTAIDQPDNYEARSQILWASEIGDNGTVCVGNVLETFPVHWMEHEISGRFNSTHGAGLAVLTPAWMEYVLSDTTAPRFAHFGRAVFGIEPGLPALAGAQKAIDALRAFFRSLDLPETLTELGVDPALLEDMAQAAEQRGTLQSWVPLAAADVLAIYRRCL